jgi:hypothetical protein
MPLYEKLKGTAGKYMGKQIPAAAQDKDKTVEFAQPGMFDKAPVHLRLFPGQEGQLMICPLGLFPEVPRVFHHSRVAYL